ncbi:NucA/NucB deoxyribonuclease domain-containing protein [Paenibacillus sp. FSL W8-1187]|uniref:NucA/NucB deoxyribonuclease domain-containing protein n=1 Tax=Paenibacillus sp. FSL W8-1187 TaxID=2975339 RepID=UPI0030D88C63
MTRTDRRPLRLLFSLLAALLLAALLGGCSFELKLPQPSAAPSGHDATIYFPSERYPDTAEHIRAAIAAGASAICTIDRDGADANRRESLQGIPTRKKFDRDEWPMAMCREGGAGADVAYVKSSDNRGAGSWIGNQLRGYEDGTRIRFVVP